MSIPNDKTPKLTVAADAANPASEPPETVPPETVRDLVVPDAEHQAKTDDDRSPGLDRDHTATQTPLPAGPARDLVLPELSEPSEDEV